MTPSEARPELLRQHGELRSLIADVRRIVDQASQGADLRHELQASVTRLADALDAHHRLEERWFSAIDSKVDGPTRAEIDVLIGSHLREHADLHAAVASIAQTPLKFAGLDVTVILNDVLDHMADEEVSLYAQGVGV